MLQSINPFERKPPNISMHWSDERQVLPTQLISACSFTRTLHEANRHDARCDHETARALGISAGYFSKFMRAAGEAWVRLLIGFMRQKDSIAPLQWIADRMDCDVVQRQRRD